ncbi:hypothetical protein Tco_0677986 [Tanacetum coccineum]|uniref:Integrase, catalytic region, zinc finger, CCHC-type, peptidase aspartic, catalytic n=1 Tax=Tanacetum coccineum TaxID=301880 RepID=A0ABQ4XDP9_9ASTR
MISNIISYKDKAINLTMATMPKNVIATGKENGDMLIDSIKNGPFQFKKEITIPAANIILLGLPIDIYTLINHYQTAKEIWDQVKELMEGTELTLQERESKLYDEFDRFVIAGKQVKDLHNVNFDQLYDFLKHNEKDAKEIREMRQRYPDPLALHVVHSFVVEVTQLDSEFVVPLFLPTDGLITSLNKAMLFFSSAISSRFLPTNNQLRTSFNPRTQTTIQDGRVTVQNVQGRRSQGYAVNTGKSQATRTRAINNVGDANAN